MPAVSDKQRKFMGIVHGIQKGEIPKSYSKKASAVASDMNPDDVADFAKTENCEEDELSVTEIFRRLIKKYRLRSL